MKDDKGKEAKRLNFSFCNRKFRERLKFKCSEVCTYRNFEEGKGAGPFFWPIVIETFSFEN
jgi:hypothetical protein